MPPRPGYPRDCGARPPRRLPEEARPGAHARAVRHGPRRRGPELRGPEARRPPSALRRAPGDGRRAQELGGAQGPLAQGRGEAAGRARRGPPRRVRGLRGHHPRGQLRRRRRHRVGPRLVSAGEGGRAGRAAAGGPARRRPVRHQAARPLDAGAHGRQGQGMADAQEGRRLRRRRGGDRALPGVGALGPHRRGGARRLRPDRDLARHAGGGAPVGEVDAARQPVMLASLAEAPFCGSGVALRDQVRRRAGAGRARWRPG